MYMYMWLSCITLYLFQRVRQACSGRHATVPTERGRTGSGTMTTITCLHATYMYMYYVDSRYMMLLTARGREESSF